MYISLPISPPDYSIPLRLSRLVQVAGEEGGPCCEIPLQEVAVSGMIKKD